MLQATGPHDVASHLLRRPGRQGSKAYAEPGGTAQLAASKAVTCAVTGPARALGRSPHGGRALCSAQAARQALPPCTLQRWLVLDMSGSHNCSGYSVSASTGILQTQQGLQLGMWFSASPAPQWGPSNAAAKTTQAADVRRSSVGCANFCQGAQSSHRFSKHAPPATPHKVCAQQSKTFRTSDALSSATPLVTAVQGRAGLEKQWALNVWHLLKEGKKAHLMSAPCVQGTVGSLAVGCPLYGGQAPCSSLLASKWMLAALQGRSKLGKGTKGWN